MKYVKIIFLCFLTIFIITGCNNNNVNVSNKPDKKIYIDENDIPYRKTSADAIDKRSVNNDVIDERYQTVDKNLLKYDLAKGDEYSFEYIDGFAVNSPLRDLKPINDKKYIPILLGYTYLSEVNSTNVSYNEAISMVKKVLPDDITEERVKESKEIPKKYIFFKSSKGNFVVGLNYGRDMNKSMTEYNKDLIVGIHYLKQIN